MKRLVHGSDPNNRFLALLIGATGVVFGDIGTSPLYAMKETFAALGSAPGFDEVLGTVSLIFWTLMIVLTLKYQFFIMHADNKGEGGTMALVAIAMQQEKDHRQRKKILLLLGMGGVALFFGDGVITPAISVLSAIEGLEVATPLLKPVVIPATLVVIIGLFVVQRHGTARVGAVFGPIVGIWFLAIALIGLWNILHHPEILRACNPFYGIQLLYMHQDRALPVLGGVFLAVTGAEALYADMGHFGKGPINWAWGGFVFPALTLNYLGQGALVLGHPEAIHNPFYLAIPTWGIYPMVVLATAATVIASQAVISGAYSASFQAMQMGLLPRMNIIHTSENEFGQIYVPTVNWTLMAAVVVLVIAFKDSSSLASAYGIAVTGTMIIVTLIAFGLVLRHLFHWGWLRTLLLLGLFLMIDSTFLCANLLKIADGGWFPLVLGSGITFLMFTWQQGRQIAGRAIRRESIPLQPFLRQLDHEQAWQGTGTAVYMSSNPDITPTALVHLSRHSQMLPAHRIILNVHFLESPFAQDHEKMLVTPLFCHFYQVTLGFGFMETPDIPGRMRSQQIGDLPFVLEDAIFYVGKASFVPSPQKEMALWRLRLYLGMARAAESASVFFNLPPQQVVDIGTRIVL
ncbi:MAG: potassium transporter Kup [Magnetococcus sp. DMHC-1]|nr:potassium transporter Kup [Magnetococcales bacterium]